MAHFAQMNGSNIVINVITISNEAIDNLPFPESEPVGVSLCKSIYGQDTLWLQTSYNGNFRKNYAGKGYSYNSSLDAFVAPKPYPSWVLNHETAQWEAPVPMPPGPGVYVWDEASKSWVKIGP